MSASLVGSEMCIRDSARSRAWAWTLLGSRWIPCLSTPKWWRTGVPRQPVSYTHLTLPTICSV
eukprot:14011536-Alexandrium_andersonii.AAC.1